MLLRLMLLRLMVMLRLPLLLLPLLPLLLLLLLLAVAAFGWEGNVPEVARPPKGTQRSHRPPHSIRVKRSVHIESMPPYDCVSMCP